MKKDCRGKGNCSTNEKHEKRESKKHEAKEKSKKKK